MKFIFLLAGASCAFAAGAADAAVSVIGNSMAQSCYEAADSKVMPRGQDLDNCDRAITQEGLSAADHVATLVNRGILHARRGATALALADYDEATKRDADQPEAYFNKAALMLKVGVADQAVPLFSKAIANKTRSMAGAYYGRGIAQENLGKLKAAYLDYRRASELAPKWAEPKTDLARFTVR